MKLVRFTLVLGIVLLATLGTAQVALAGGGTSTVDPANCALNAWSPELFSFYGDKATVLAKFQALNRNLLNHRTFAFIVETNHGAKLSFFELQGKITEGTTMDLASTGGKSFNDLSHQITTALLSNTGAKCAGMMTKEILANYTKGQMDHTVVPRPATAGDAFQYAVAQADGEYIQATFILLC
jgi:hypothetical protein